MSNIQARKDTGELNPVLYDKLVKSREEAKNLTVRDIRCPFCGFLIDKVYSDISGHKDIFCRKCKRKYIINLGYFRRQNKKPYFKILFPDNGRQNR